MGLRACRHGQWAVVRADIVADISRYLTRSPEDHERGDSFKRRLSAMLTPQLMALALYRLSHYLYVRGWTLGGHWLAGLNFVLHKVRFSAASCVGPGCRLAHPAGVVFEGSAGSELTLFSYAICVAGSKAARHGGPRLGNRVTLGGHAVIGGDIAIGDDVRIGPCAVVERDVASGMLVASQAMHTRSHARAVQVPDTEQVGR